MTEKATNPAPAKQRSRVEPRTLKGFQDYLPEAAIQRQQVINQILPVFASYGFVPLESPMVEYLDTLLGTGGENTNKELFRFESPEEEAIALRFDLTVPFARLLAQYPDKLKPPFRRFAVGPVFRADKPGPGRFRQFTQVDIDAAGSNDVAVDAEICSILCEVMERLGVADYKLEINSRRVVDALLIECGLTDIEKQKAVLRTVDKLSKVGLSNVRLELGPGRVDESGDPIRGLQLDVATIDRISEFVAIQGKTRLGVIESLEKFLSDGKAKDEALKEMRELADNLDALGVAEERAVFDPSLARGLDYYTGPVFEMKLPAAPQFGTVAAGGRYDKLVERFTSNQMTATGASFGLDRLLAALEFLRGESLPQTTTDVLIVTFRDVPKSKYLNLAKELRSAGLNVEVYFGKRKAGVTDQLSKANAVGIPVAVIAGEDEFARGEVAVKDMRAGAEARATLEDRDAYLAAAKAGQVSVKREELVTTVKKLLEG